MPAQARAIGIKPPLQAPGPWFPVSDLSTFQTSRRQVCNHTQHCLFMFLVRACSGIMKTVQAVFPELLMYHDGFEDGKLAISIYIAALQRKEGSTFVMPKDPVPDGIAQTIEAVFEIERGVDQRLLAEATILEDDFNPFSFQYRVGPVLSRIGLDHASAGVPHQLNERDPN